MVWFNDEAGIAQPLTNDRTAIMSALDQLEQYQQEGTRIDLAFERGAEALGPEYRLNQNTPVMIMLTDGLPNRVPLDPETNRMEETVIDAAQAAKDAGIRVYTVGFGKRPGETDDITELVYPWLLEVTSSGEGHHFISPNADDLRAIYDEIANVFTCPKGRHDWSQPWPPERGRAVRIPIARPIAADR